MSCSPGKTGVTSEESLLSHEREIEKLVGMYAENKQVLDLVQAHADLLQEMEDFEETTNDPDRLTSRSQRDPGRLLRELPKIEASLRELLVAHKTAHSGEPFLIFGRDYLEKMDDIEETRMRLKRTPMKPKARLDEYVATPSSSRKVSLMVTPSKGQASRQAGQPLTPSGKPNMTKSVSTPSMLGKMAAPSTPSLKRKFEEGPSNHLLAVNDPSCSSFVCFFFPFG